MTKIVNKKILIFLLILLVAFTMLYSIMSSSALSNNNFDSEDVMKDLENAENFDFNKYPAGSNREMEIANFVEYCYSPISNHQANYGLYIYLYNPKNVKFKKDAENTIQLAISAPDGSVSKYQKYKIKHLSESKGDYANLFHKFKIMDGENEKIKFKDLLKLVNSNKRIYNVSGIELIKEDNQIEDYGIGGQYVFTGYAKGYGLDTSADTTLKSEVKTTETIQLDVESTFYRLPGQSAAGVGHKDNLSSVYFAIDNSTLEKWGNLNAIRATWFETHVVPTVITNRKDVYDDLMDNAVGKVIPTAQQGLIYNNYYLFSTEHLAGGADKYKYCWNAPSTASSYPNQANYYEQLTNLHYTTADLTGNDSNSYARIDKRTQTEYWKNYNKSFVSGRIGRKQYSADLFIPKADDGRIYGFNDVTIDNRQSWDLYSYKANNYTWEKLNFKDSASDIFPIKKIETKIDLAGGTEDISNRLYIDINDVDMFEQYNRNAVSKNQTTYLFRFAVTDTFSGRVYIGEPNNAFPSNKNAYVFMQTAFLDFDIIELTFNKDGVFKVIPVVMNPIDIVSDTTLPPEVEKGIMDGILAIIIILFAFLFILWVLQITGLLPYVTSAVKWVITAPFKFVGSLFKQPKGGADKGNKASPINIYTGDIKATEQAKTNAKQRYKTSYKGDTKNEKEKKSKGNKKRSKQSKKADSKKTYKKQDNRAE